MKTGLLLILLSICAAALAVDAREVSVLCQALPERAIPEAKGARVLMTQFAGKNELFRNGGALISPKVGTTLEAAPKLGGVRRVSVDSDDVNKVCEAGYDVSVISIADSFVPIDSQKGYVSPMSSMPSAFTIAGLWDQTRGNFWVPQSLPLSDKGSVWSLSFNAVNAHTGQ